MAEEVLPSDEKCKLVVALPSIKFVEDDDLKPYKCKVCGNVAIYHYFATCQHLFCGNCHGIYANKACPIDNCANKSIDQVYQSLDQELGVYNLRTYCLYKDNGCKEIVTLSNIMAHKHKCKFSTRKLLPKIWTPKVNAHDFDKMMSELAELKERVANLEQQDLSNYPNVEKNIRREIDQQNRDFEEKLDIIKKDLPVDVTLSLGPKIDRKFQEIEKNLEKEIAELKINNVNAIQSKMEVIEKIAENQDRKINENFANVYKENSEKLTFLENQLERSMKESEEKLAKEINDQKINTDTIIKCKLDGNLKQMEDYVQKSVNEFKSKLKTLTNRHRENSDAIRALHEHGDITTYIDEEGSQQLFPDVTLQVLNKKVENIWQYLKQEKTNSFTWKIEGFSVKLQDLKSGKQEKISSGYFKTECAKIKEKVKMLYNSEKQTMEIWSDVKNWLVDIPDKFRKHFENYQSEICILDQSDNAIKKNISSNDDYAVSNSYWFDDKCYGRIPIKYLESESRYVRNDSIHIVIRSIPYSIVLNSFYTDNGVLFWKLNNFKQLKQDGINGVSGEVLSEYFYSKGTPNLMQLSVKFEETGASFVIQCRKHLQRYRGLKFTIIIFDQSNMKEKRHLTNTKYCKLEKSDWHWYYNTLDEEGYTSEMFHFIYAEHENMCYLKNDCLLIKVTVEEIAISPPQPPKGNNSD